MTLSVQLNLFTIEEGESAMGPLEIRRLREIEAELASVQKKYRDLSRVCARLNRDRKKLEKAIESMREEKLSIQQGQLLFPIAS